jgi:heme-degrading monooxygenase HmoA
MIYELRTYTAAPGKLEQLHRRFREHTLRAFARNGFEVIGFWEPLQAANRELVYLLAFPDQAAQQTAWAKMEVDPEWSQARAESKRNGILVETVVSRLMQPTDYSALQ